MSIVPQNADKEVAIIDCVHRFFSSHHVGDLLKKCNGTKEKGVSAVSLLRYRLGNVFADRSMYMQMRTGSFKEDFFKTCKSTLNLVGECRSLSYDALTAHVEKCILL